jgi:hypothetical protein
MLRIFVWRADARAGLPRRRFAPPRNDAEALCEPTLFNCQTARRLSADARHRPCSHLGAGLAVLVLFLLPIGACGTLGERPRPRRSHVLHASTPYAVVLATSYGGPARRSKGNDTRGRPSSTSKAAEPDRPRKQIFTCVPHADGFVRLAGCPRDGCLRQRPPVRASCRPDMHSSRPPVTPGSAPSATEGPTGSSTRPGPDIVADLRIPLSRLEDHRNAPLIGAGWRDDSSPIANVKNKMRTLADYFF